MSLRGVIPIYTQPHPPMTSLRNKKVSVDKYDFVEGGTYFILFYLP